MFQDPFFILILLACGGVAVILGLGISTFGKDGMDNARKSNKYMRWRIIAQFIAVLVILAFFYIRRVGG